MQVKDQLSTIIDQLEKYKKENEEIKKKLAEQQGAVKTINNTTYNISVKNYIQQKFPNAPALSKILDYSKLTYKDYKLMDTLVYNYNNNNLHKYLGHFIISYYKKDDPSEQSLWSSDTSRLTYIISELLSNKKSVWNHDYRGTKVKEYIIAPLLEYIRSYIDSFFSNIEIKKPNLQDFHKLESEFNYRKSVAEIAKSIDNNILIDDILKYISPYFCIDRETLENTHIKQITYFIDEESDESNNYNDYPFIDKQN
jgi:hypothetical protein